jgi:hypothetical protein
MRVEISETQTELCGKCGAEIGFNRRVDFTLNNGRGIADHLWTMQAKTATEIRCEAFQDQIQPAYWRVETIDSQSGDAFVAVFSGPRAEDRASEYAAFKN